MEPARARLEKAINNTKFATPVCPVYQNATALPNTEPEKIKANLIAQLTAPVRWTQTVENMIKDGAVSFTEAGPGNVLQGLVKKINNTVETIKL
jgi:[acyl-carrier-protein] S-malonyltransferase